MNNNVSLESEDWTTVERALRLLGEASDEPVWLVPEDREKVLRVVEKIKDQRNAASAEVVA